ncbi:hypothetical protein HDV00_003060 [Rhizophlyctis rosea]|nr:hypothetical protein HDV00_003060 [Rhizophlyctis rosea]
MANRTATDAKQIHGTNPQFLIEKIVRTRIWDSLYWKEKCFALTAETLIDRAVELTAIGGQYGNQRPTEFLCLTLKLLQLQPEKEIVRLYIQNEDYKYLRALGAFYLRLTGTALEIYSLLEPLLADSRKLRRRQNSGAFDLTYMDEFVDELLRSDRVCDTILPRLPRRETLEETGDLEGPRRSVLEDELEEEEVMDLEGVEGSEGGRRGSRSRSASRSGGEEEVSRGGEQRRRERNGSVEKGRRSEGSVEKGGRGERTGEESGRPRDERAESERDRERRGRYDDDRRHDDRRRDRDDYDRRDDRRGEDRYRSGDGYRDRRDDRREEDRYRDRGDDRRGGEDRYRDSRREEDRYRDRRDDRRDRDRDRDRDYRDGDRERRRDDREISDFTHPDRRRPSSPSPPPPTTTDDKKKKSYSTKKFDALFKKKDPSSSSSRADVGAGGGGGGGGETKESMSIQETNKMRAALGLKPLKM